ncbi:MAG: penicillin-binding protein 2 [Burkholderiales bacterium]|nr:penicillin-binding protein 2 [Burkholderiales bacterium]
MMRLLRMLFGFLISPAEERRGKNDTVQDMLSDKIPALRSNFLFFILFIAFLALFGRLAYLQLGFDTDFLKKQGEMRFQRTLDVPAMRGKILDRNGAILATSVPAKALWLIPQDASPTDEQLKYLSKKLQMPLKDLKEKFSSEKTFVYLKRQVPNDLANEILDQKIAGVHWTREYIRQYPNGTSMAQIVGLTGIDGNGMEGMELSEEKRLAGKTGSRRVLKDRLGRIIQDAWIKEPQNGEDIWLTIDSRIQYLAYSLLEKQVHFLGAKAGAVVVADPRTGDILALANYPSFDPNDRQKFNRAGVRNRAITDTYEPGSTMKPFSVSAGLNEKKVTPNTVFQIGKSLQFGRMSIGDSHYSKELTVSGIIKQSSNIGTSKIALLMSPQTMWSYYNKLGFGRSPQVGFPGAVAGRLRPAKSWRPIEQATMSYGHGVTVSLLQLVQAYTAIARNGDLIPLSIYKDRDPIESIPVFTEKTASQMKTMLASVVEKGGTGTKAAIEGFSVAGKTGTAYKVEKGQYVHKYVSSFTGFAPAQSPRIIVGVMIDEPMIGKHFGATAAGPLFANIASGTLSYLAVNPDKPLPPGSLKFADNKSKQGANAKATKTSDVSTQKHDAPAKTEAKPKKKESIKSIEDDDDPIMRLIIGKKDVKGGRKNG